MARLYKYYSISDDEKYQRIVNLLDSQEVFLTDGLKFNDPFDLRITNRNVGKLVFVEKFRILCLTSSYSNKLMWSHYADSHRGICVTMEIADDLIFPVYYTRERVYDDTDLDILMNQPNKRKVKRNLSKSYDTISSKKVGYVKDSTWVYENEYRVVFHDQERTKLIEGERLKVKIHKVYLGNCIDLQKESQLRKICSANHIDVVKTRFKDEGYAIRTK